MKKVSVIGAGTMGMGIAQIAATYGGFNSIKFLLWS